MAEKVTLWKAGDGMHYATQGEAEIAEARAELDRFLRDQGLGDNTRATIIRLAMVRREIGNTDDGRRTYERGADVLARFAATLKRHSMHFAGMPGTREEIESALKPPEPVKVAEPVRRRAIRSPGPREPETAEGD